MQQRGTAACLKHLVANGSETLRNFMDSRLSESALRELYLLPLAIAVQDAHAWSMMAAYNDVNGVPATEQDHVQNGIVTGECDWDGLIMSDWSATKRTAASADGGLDLVMPGPDGPRGDRLVAAVRAGEVAEGTLDGHVLRLLRLADRVGGLTPEGQEPRRWAQGLPAVDSPVRQEQLRRIAVRGMTVVADNGVLPLATGAGSDDGTVALDPVDWREILLADASLGLAEESHLLGLSALGRTALGAAPAWDVVPDEDPVLSDDGTFAGHRGYHAGHAPAPLFWFGHGLGYGTWEYGTVQVHEGPAGPVVCDARLLRRWDEAAGGWEFLDGLVDLVRHNQDQPGIVRLFTTVTAEAVDPDHPANSWLRHHHGTTAERLRAALAEAAEDGRLADEAPVESIVRCVIATMDGLQVQWLADTGYPDMAEDLAVLVDALRRTWGR